jgi:hypothetical protein
MLPFFVFLKAFLHLLLRTGQNKAERGIIKYEISPT